MSAPHSILEQISLLESSFSNHGFRVSIDGTQVTVTSEYDSKDKSVVLECSDNLVLLKHRDVELTEKYKGRKVTLDWLIGYVTEHSNEALIEQKETIKRFDEELKKRDRHELKVAREAREERAEKQVKEELAREEIRRKVLAQHKTKNSVGSTNPYKQASRDTCPVCLGDGGVGGNCFKCFGSGWVEVENTIVQNSHKNKPIESEVRSLEAAQPEPVQYQQVEQSKPQSFWAKILNWLLR